MSQYGLLMPKAKAAPPKRKPAKSTGAAAAFGGDSDSDSDDGAGAAAAAKGGRAGVNYMMMKEAEKNKKAKKTKAAWQKTLEDDATAFQYDEIYDKMEEKKAATEAKAEEAKKDRAKKPKYINALLETAKKKKLHDELREERQAQKEREEEGEEYSDKDKFVTGLKKLAEEDKRQEAADAANDVTKRKDMSDFYRNQFRVDGKGAAAVAADGDGGAGAADNSGGSAAGDSKAEGGADAIDGTEPGGVAGAGSDGAGGPSEFKRPMKRPNRGSRPGGGKGAPPGKIQRTEKQEDPEKYARKTSESAVLDAKARYLARKSARNGSRALPTMDD
eukprot:gene243-13446_t